MNQTRILVYEDMERFEQTNTSTSSIFLLLVNVIHTLGNLCQVTAKKLGNFLKLGLGELMVNPCKKLRLTLNFYITSSSVVHHLFSNSLLALNLATAVLDLILSQLITG